MKRELKKEPCPMCGSSESLWFSFLNLRAKLIDELLSEPKSFEDVALTLSMTAEQVRRIQERCGGRKDFELTGFDT